MKETKIFFDNSNRLNKGYTEPVVPPRSDNAFYRKKFEHILPPLDLISEYESINPGTLASLISIAEKEQQHKHALDLAHMRTYNKANLIGQICAVIFITIVSITTLGLAIFSTNLVAELFFATAFLTVVILSFWFYKKANKKKYSEPTNTNNNFPQPRSNKKKRP